MQCQLSRMQQQQNVRLTEADGDGVMPEDTHFVVTICNALP